MVNNIDELENKIIEFTNNEKKKIELSVMNKIAEDDSKGISQMIGRRYGFIWEEIVKIIFNHSDNIQLGDKIYYKDYVEKWINYNSANFKNECCKTNSKDLLWKYINESTGTESQDLCDFTLEYNGKRIAIDTKYRFNSNDSNTVREISNSAIYLKEMGFIPIMLIRRNREESQQAPLKRFEKNGWQIIDGANAINFIKELTEFDLKNTIINELDIWDYLSNYHNELIKLRFGEREWIY